MWPDLLGVPLFKTDYPLVDKLPRVRERLNASLFFIQEAGHHMATMNDPTNKRSGAFTWLCWSSMVALSAAREAIAEDLLPFKLKFAFNRSQEEKDIRRDPVIAVLNELRNYSIHFDFQPIEEKSFTARWNDEEIDFGKYPYFEPIDWPTFRQLFNVRQKDAVVTKDMVEWFNRQSAKWPTINMIAVGGDRLAQILSRFIVREINPRFVE